MLLDKIVNTVFSFGAAVVIFGAWGKLESKDFGNTALTAGLLTETPIFCLYGLLEWIHRPASRAEVSGLQESAATGTARQDEHIATPAQTTEHASVMSRSGERTGLLAGSDEHVSVEHRAGSLVHKEDLEALTGSIKETANLLARIFRV